MEKESKKKSIWSIIISSGLWCIAVAYLFALAKIVVFKNGFTTEFRALNLIPFQFILDFITAEMSIDVLLKNTLGNIAIFIPMGILLPALFKNVHAKKTVLLCFLISLSIEVSQYIVGLGIADIDDLILNTLGGAVGALLYFGLLKKLDSKVKGRIATLVFLGMFGLCGVLSLWLYQPYIIPTKTKIINLEVLGDLDPDSADVIAVCTGVDGNNLKVKLYDKSGNDKNKKDAQFIMNNNTRFFSNTIATQYSPNGNVQKVFVTYDKITKENLEKIVAEEGQTRVCLWTSDDNKCTDVLVWMWESEHQQET